MGFGKIEENEQVIEFNLELKYNNCNKKIQERMKSVKNYFKSIKFNK